MSLPSRPIHLSTDSPSEHALIAYNNPSGITVHRINRDRQRLNVWRFALTPGREISEALSHRTGTKIEPRDARFRIELVVGHEARHQLIDRVEGLLMRFGSFYDNRWHLGRIRRRHDNSTRIDSGERVARLRLRRYNLSNRSWWLR
jgi:hypothetical protein